MQISGAVVGGLSGGQGRVGAESGVGLLAGSQTGLG